MRFASQGVENALAFAREIVALLIGMAEEIELAAEEDAAFLVDSLEHALPQQQADQLIDRGTGRTQLRGDLVGIGGLAFQLEIFEDREGAIEAARPLGDLLAVQCVCHYSACKRPLDRRPAPLARRLIGSIVRVSAIVSYGPL